MGVVICIASMVDRYRITEADALASYLHGIGREMPLRENDR